MHVRSAATPAFAWWLYPCCRWHRWPARRGLARRRTAVTWYGRSGCRIDGRHACGDALCRALPRMTSAVCCGLVQCSGGNRFLAWRDCTADARCSGDSSGYPSSEWIDVVQDSDLPQQHLADDVGRLDVLREDGRRPGATGRQATGELRVIEPDPCDKVGGLYVLRRYGETRCLRARLGCERLRGRFRPCP